MRFEIDSYLQQGSEFIPISDVVARPTDVVYLEGAIIWRIDGASILTEVEHDLVDQLWAYLITGLESLLSTGKFHTYFPDQPLELAFRRLSNREVLITVGDRSVRVDFLTMIDSLVSGAKEFFFKMKELVPEDSDSWGIQLAKIAQIEDIVRAEYPSGDASTS